MNDQTEKLPQRSFIKRERGKGFPKLSLSSAIEIMEKASKYGRQWTREQFASFGSKAGAGSAKSGAFLNRLAALRDFGLINTSGALIIRADLTDQIVKPVKPEEKDEAIRQAFLNVEIFKTIVENVVQNEDLTKNDIAEMAVKQLGVSRSSKDTFISNFVESGKYAGIINEVDNNTVQVAIPSVPGESQEQSVSPTGISPAITNINQTIQTDSISTTLSTRRAGKVWDLSVQVRSSNDISPNVLGKIIKLIQDAEDIAKLFKKGEEEDGITDNKS